MTVIGKQIGKRVLRGFFPISNQERRRKMARVFSSVKEIFDGMAGTFNPNAAAGLNAVVQYNIEGADGGDWYVVIKDQTCTVSQGVHTSPTLTMKMADKDWTAMCNGQLNGMTAFMTGKLKTTGDIMLAQRLTTLFPTS
ncbi:MAG TPA: SCP2 sterol-binding domain-containing protein [Thermodesulfobacteriota bacterium]|nr:SCP2 sterol-binding domain-containing protein [Thermodesulfobacteriota bacterium]